jgi:hypothetical protein
MRSATTRYSTIASPCSSLRPRALVSGLVLCLGLGLGHVLAQDFRQALNPDFDRALEFIADHRERIERGLGTYGVDPGIMVPVVFPELVRYAHLRDTIETAALFLLYTNYGPAYANFSIGPLQMKPSFVEALEEEIKRSSDGMLKPIADYPASLRTAEGSARAIRAERVRRLQDLDWQLRYLAAFAQLTIERYPGLATMLPEEQVLLLSVFYNAGQHLSLEEAIERIDAAYFPIAALNQRVPYARIALDYYRMVRNNE